MEHYLLRLFFFASGLLLATVAGTIRYRQIDKSYRPIIIYLYVGVLNEIVSFFSGLWFKTNLINNNIFMLAELLLLNWQLRLWNPAAGSNRNHAAALFFVLLFVVEVMWRGIDHNLFYFNALYCFYLVMSATNIMAGIVAFSVKKLYTHATFIFVSAMVIYFSARVIVEAFWFHGLLKTALFRNEVYLFLQWTNLFVNLMYLFAILWIQKKPAYITFYG